MAETPHKQAPLRIELVDPAPRTGAAAVPPPDTPPPASAGRAAAPERDAPAYTPPTLNDAKVRETYTALNARFERSLGILRGNRELTDAEREALNTRHSQLRADMDRMFVQLDTQAARVPDARGRQQLEARLDRIPGEFDTRLTTLEAGRASPDDPFDADGFFNAIEPGIRNMAFATGEMARTGVDGFVSGMQSLWGAVTHPARAGGNVMGSARNAGGNFMSGLRENGGKIAGGLLGAIGAFFISGMVPGGPLRWAVMLMLMPLGMMLGANKFSGPIDNMLGNGRPRANGGNEPQRAQGGQPELAAQPETPAAAPQAVPAMVASGPQPLFSGDGPLALVPPQDRAHLRNATGVHTAVPPSVAQRVSYDPETAAIYHEGMRSSSPRVNVNARGIQSERRADGSGFGVSTDGDISLRSGHGSGITLDRSSRTGNYHIRP